MPVPGPSQPSSKPNLRRIAHSMRAARAGPCSTRAKAISASSRGKSSGRPASAAPTRPAAENPVRPRALARAGRCARCSEASFADLPSTRFSETVGAACLAKHDGQVIQLDHPGAGHHIVNHPRRYRPACAPYHLQVVGAAAGNAQGASTAAAPDPSRRAHRARADRPPWRVFPAHIAITPSFGRPPSYPGRSAL